MDAEKLALARRVIRKNKGKPDHFENVSWRTLNTAMGVSHSRRDFMFGYIQPPNRNRDPSCIINSIDQTLMALERPNVGLEVGQDWDTVLDSLPSAGKVGGYMAALNDLCKQVHKMEEQRREAMNIGHSTDDGIRYRRHSFRTQKAMLRELHSQRRAKEAASKGDDNEEGGRGEGGMEGEEEEEEESEDSSSEVVLFEPTNSRVQIATDVPSTLKSVYFANQTLADSLKQLDYSRKESDPNLTQQSAYYSAWYLSPKLWRVKRKGKPLLEHKLPTPEEAALNAREQRIRRALPSFICSRYRDWLLETGVSEQDLPHYLSSVSHGNGYNPPRRSTNLRNRQSSVKMS